MGIFPDVKKVTRVVPVQEANNTFYKDIRKKGEYNKLQVKKKNKPDSSSPEFNNGIGTIIDITI